MKKFSFLARTSLIVGVFFGLDKVLAFVRTGIISRQFRDSLELLDTFNAANNLPDVLFALISGGALAMAFIPLMSEYLTTRGRPAAWDLFSRVANLAFLVTGSIAIIVAIFAEPIVNAEIGIAPGFGFKALRHAEAHPAPIQLLLTDVVMPGMSGRAVAEGVAAIHPEARVLFMSGYTDDAIVRHGVLEPGIGL